MQKPRYRPGEAEYSEKEGRDEGEVAGEVEEGEKKERRGVRVLSQGTMRAPWRLRHWVHWQVWVWGWGGVSGGVEGG